MILCGHDCVPCCDFCMYAEHKTGNINGKMVKLAVIGCNLHKDKEHQDLAVSCSYCDDYHCFKVRGIEG